MVGINSWREIEVGSVSVNFNYKYSLECRVMMCLKPVAHSEIKLKQNTEAA